MVVLSSTAPAPQPIFEGLALATGGTIAFDVATGLALGATGAAVIPTNALIAGKILLAKKALLAHYLASQEEARRR